MGIVSKVEPDMYQLVALNIGWGSDNESIVTKSACIYPLEEMPAMLSVSIPVNPPQLN